MELTLLQIGITALALLIVGVLFGRLRKPRQGDSLFARIFKDNRDFDSTLDRLSITAVILLMLILFHNDMTDPAKSGLIINIFLMAFNAWQALVLGKALKDASKNEQERKPQ